ncbi:hypothetical protein [Bacillus sp. FJAT-28004]|uniref:hypothetical protein n=1 Tax=Bacillus sp. FJAT-28004 TaxID=1679165 RepID=UPI0006B40FB2|nr:hypothetical protein [Bacillus sp. FJAT-28004]
MTNTVSLVSELPIEVLHKQSIVLLHKIDAVSDGLALNFSSGLIAINNDVCLSTTLACEEPNTNIAANTFVVQVLAAMKKA